MAKYVRKRMYKRSRGSKTTRRRFARRSSGIKKLARAVRKLQRDVNVKVQRLNLGNTLDFTLSQDVTYVNLTNYSYQNRIFGTDADDLLNDSVRHVSTGVDCLFKANTEKDNINFTCFLVSCTDECSNMINFTNSSISLTSGLHYYWLGGLAMVNKKYFKVHKVKRFTTGNFGSPLTQSAAVGPVGQKRWYFKFRPNMVVKNKAGNWKDLACPLDPSQNYYLLMFNDNSVLDLENPSCIINFVSTFRG